jgi:predicted component of type VI protein secretion system
MNQEHLATLMEASRLLADDSDYVELEPKLQKVFDFLEEAMQFTEEQKELLLDLLTNHQHICEDDIQDEQYQEDLKLILATKKVLGKK